MTAPGGPSAHGRRRRACFSLHPRKVVTVGDGGMLTTRDRSLDARFRLLRQHGMSVPDTVRHAAPRSIFESYETEAFNYRLTDIQAAVGIEQLKRLPDIVARRRALAERYHRRLASEVPEVSTPVEPNRARTNWQSYAVRLPDGADQRAVMQVMLDHGIATRRASCHPPRGPLCWHRTLPAAGFGGRTGPHDPAAALSADDRGGARPGRGGACGGRASLTVGARRIAILGASGNALDNPRYPRCPAAEGEVGMSRPSWMTTVSRAASGRASPLGQSGAGSPSCRAWRAARRGLLRQRHRERRHAPVQGGPSLPAPALHPRATPP